MNFFRKSTPKPQNNKKNNPNFKKVFGADRIGIAGFHDRGFVIARPVESYAPWLQQRSQELYQKIGGLTNMAEGLRVGTEMLKKTPSGILRRMWFLSDGDATCSLSAIMNQVEEARRARININTIGFGDSYNEALLKKISAGTHNGQFFKVASLRQLSDALVLGGGTKRKPGQKCHTRAETTILTIDLSGSMVGPMEGKRKIEVVQEAILHLLHYKQKCFS